MWISSVTIGAPNPRDLAAFYERLLGWAVSTVGRSYVRRTTCQA